MSLIRVEAKRVCTTGSGLVFGAAPVHAARAARCSAAVASAEKCTTTSRLLSEALHDVAASNRPRPRPTAVRALTSASLRVVEDPEPIESYALLGDMQTAALVSRSGSVDWLCLPRFDSPACFASLLGDAENGQWRIAPTGARHCDRRAYDGDSLVLYSEWETTSGLVRVIDFMPPRGEAPDVVRIVEGISGRVEVTSELRLRFDYGSIVPWVRRNDRGLTAIGGPDSVHLATPVALEARDFSHVATFTVGPGDRVPFVLTWQASHRPPPDPVDPEQALADTRAFWEEWIANCTYDGEWRDAVVRSLITLKALTYQPTGGITAAATMSLPEAIGGDRNWDYRYCWLRDASMTLQTMLYTGFTDEAREWREWLLRSIAGDPAQLRIMYGLGGERRLPESELPWLSGYAGSRPVRVGNAASEQFQLDVYGEVLDAMHLDRCSGLSPSDDAWSMQRGLMDVLEGKWDEPDKGLWRCVATRSTTCTPRSWRGRVSTARYRVSSGSASTARWTAGASSATGSTKRSANAGTTPSEA